MTADVVELVDRYVDGRVAAGQFADSTATKVRTTLRMWARDAGPVDSWTAAAVEAWANTPGLTYNTQRTRADRLRGFCGWLVERGHLDQNPVVNRRNLELPAVESDLVDRYIEWRKLHRSDAPTTLRVTRCDLRQWHRHAGPIAEWQTDIVAAWVNDPRLRVATRRGRLARLRGYMRWLAKVGTLECDLTEDIRPPRRPQSAPRNLSAEDVAKVLAACPDDRARLIVLLMVQCGLRCGDAARMRVEDLDDRTMSLNVRAKGGGGEPTHWVPVPTEAWEALTAWVEGLGYYAGPVFPSRGRPGRSIDPVTVSKLVRSWMGAAGIKRASFDGISPHALRHTCAQDMLDHGADLRQVQFALGHRSIKSTEIYARREPQGLRDAMEGRRYA